MDIYIDGRKVDRKSKSDISKLGCFWDTQLAIEYADLARKANKEKTPKIKDTKKVEARNNRTVSGDSGLGSETKKPPLEI